MGDHDLMAVPVVVALLLREYCRRYTKTEQGNCKVSQQFTHIGLLAYEVSLHR
jgi:hypothetical protein